MALLKRNYLTIKTLSCDLWREMNNVYVHAYIIQCSVPLMIAFAALA